MLVYTTTLSYHLAMLQFAVFEDEQRERDSARSNLEILGHTVVAEAESAVEAGLVLRDHMNGDICIDAILQDGNTRTLDYGGFAKEVLRFLNIHQLEIPVIGYSTQHMTEFGINPDQLFADPTKDLFTDSALYEPLMARLIERTQQS